MQEKSKPLTAAEIASGRENLASLRWIADRIQTKGFCRIGEWLQNISTLDLISVQFCLTALRSNDTPTIGKAEGGRNVRKAVIEGSFDPTRKKFDTKNSAPLQAVFLAEMLTVGEGLPTIFDDVYRSSMAVGLLNIYTILEQATRIVGGEISLDYDALSMDPDFVNANWNRVVSFDKSNDEVLETMTKISSMIEALQAGSKFIKSNYEETETSFGYEEPKVDPKKIAESPAAQMQDLSSRLKGLLGK